MRFWFLVEAKDQPTYGDHYAALEVSAFPTKKLAEKARGYNSALILHVHLRDIWEQGLVVRCGIDRFSHRTKAWREGQEWMQSWYRAWRSLNGVAKANTAKYRK